LNFDDELKITNDNRENIKKEEAGLKRPCLSIKNIMLKET